MPSKASRLSGSFFKYEIANLNHDGCLNCLYRSIFLHTYLYIVLGHLRQTQQINTNVILITDLQYYGSDTRGRLAAFKGIMIVFLFSSKSCCRWKAYLNLKFVPWAVLIIRFQSFIPLGFCMCVLMYLFTFFTFQNHWSNWTNETYILEFRKFNFIKMKSNIFLGDITMIQ